MSSNAPGDWSNPKPIHPWLSGGGLLKKRQPDLGWPRANICLTDLPTSSGWTIVERVPNPISPVDYEFEKQKTAFKKIPPLALVPYQGLFVASRNGEIVDSDTDLPSLTNRFFSQYGDVPVCITRIGRRPRVLLRTPHR
jgi:hypothetical protein